MKHKPSKKLHLVLTNGQIVSLKKFLLTHKIKCDGKIEFGLIAEPKITRRELIVRLLSISEYNKIDKYFQRLGLYYEE